jgi:hypothetical protein
MQYGCQVYTIHCLVWLVSKEDESFGLEVSPALAGLETNASRWK